MAKNTYVTGAELKEFRLTLCKDSEGMAALFARTVEAYAELEKSGIRTSTDARVTKESLNVFLAEGPYAAGAEKEIKDPDTVLMVKDRREAIQAFISKLT